MLTTTSRIIMHQDPGFLEVFKGTERKKGLQTCLARSSCLIQRAISNKKEPSGESDPKQRSREFERRVMDVDVIPMYYQVVLVAASPKILV